MPGFRPVAAEATFLLGARDFDPPEATLLAESKVTRLSVSQVTAQLSDLVVATRLEEGLSYLHVDLDVLDLETVGRANSLPVPGGLSVAQLNTAICSIRTRMPLGAATIASYAPEYDRDHGICRAAFAALDAILASGA